MVENLNLYKRKYLNAYYLYSCTYYWSFAALQSVINIATATEMTNNKIKAMLWTLPILCIPLWLVLFFHVKFSDRQHFVLNSIVM